MSSYRFQMKNEDGSVTVTAEGDVSITIPQLEATSVLVTTYGGAALDFLRVDAKVLVVESRGTGEVRVRAGKANGGRVTRYCSGEINLNGDFANVERQCSADPIRIV